MKEQKEQNRKVIEKLRPHYIFNVLWNIQYLYRVDPKRGEKMLMDFSSFLRYNSITSIDIYLEENEESTEIFSSEKFTEIFNISRLVNKYYPSDALIAIYFRNVQGTAN